MATHEYDGSNTPPDLDAVDAASAAIPGAAQSAFDQAHRNQAAARAQALDQTRVEAAKYDVGQEDPETAASRFSSTDTRALALANVDDDLPDLPGGYGQARMVLMPRDAKWAYAYWDVPDAARQPLRQLGGRRLVLRLYDITTLTVDQYSPAAVQQYEVDELAQNWYLEVPMSDRHYMAELGYLTDDEQWLSLARSPGCRMPPLYPSDWVNDQIITVRWDESLRGRQFADLGQPPQANAMGHWREPLHEQMFRLSQPRAGFSPAGSLFGSMLPQGAISSYSVASGSAAWTLPTVSGQNFSGVGRLSDHPAASVPRQFWFEADAELIIYGATDPDATLTIGGEPVPLNPDGTFRLQLSFQDGRLDFPVMAVAADGEQMRQVHLRFQRATPVRRTNPAAAAQLEWPEA